MKSEKEKIDLLFEKNAAEQLSGVDWDGFGAVISRRVAAAEARKSFTWKYRSVFKIAAGVAAAAVVFIVVMISTEKPAALQLEDGRKAAVKLIESKGRALVEIKYATGRSNVTVEVGGGQIKMARCDVEIIDLNGDLKEESRQAAWIIISRAERVLADNGFSRDVMSMICLF